MFLKLIVNEAIYLKTVLNIIMNFIMFLLFSF